MRTLDYIGLDTTRVRGQFEKVRAALERDDFRSADLKKLAGAPGFPLYRAKLDDANRLLLTFLRHGEETCALLLEVVAQHAYEKSRFLRGARIDEARIPAAEPTPAALRTDCTEVRYLHPQRREIHLLDKILSFDDAQDAIWRLAPPLILVGGAGSGKTALVLERIKAIDGDVLYVTQSSYLAENARGLYYANGFEREGQQLDFLSYGEFVESLQVPEGREVQWRDFAAWFARHRVAFRDFDGHQVFEEIRGVLAADEHGVLDREAYRALGVRQSIFLGAQRDSLYDLFEKYRAWLKEEKRFDPGLIVHEWRGIASTRYDFAVVDEAQDLTAAQLALVLATLRQPDRFLLCGDSNQIVHPNLFSWSRVKSLLWGGELEAARHELHVLRANFRNGREATRVANTLLKIKHSRFGSIDRESNFLVNAIGEEAGEVIVLADRETALRELDARIRRSARFAVLVMRDEDKAAAREFFHTPLLFSVREAKGLEYDNIVLFRFVASERTRFAEIADGVAPDDLAGNELAYRRARDKSDKSPEVYKFFVNALYVALTRAIRNVYLVEPDARHPLLELLQLRGTGDGPVRAETSSIEEWQREASRLDRLGKQEQAESIRTAILRQTPVPWPVADEAWLRATIVKVFRDRVPGGKPRRQLLEHAACHDLPALARRLADELMYDPARRFGTHQPGLVQVHLHPYAARNFRDVLRQCDQHGVDYRTPMNLTPLMAASASGNVPLVDALLERGADARQVDHFGRAAVHWSLATAFREPAYAQGAFAAIYERVAPASIDLRIDDRLVRIDRHLSEYLMWQTLWTLYGRVMSHGTAAGNLGFDTASILKAWKHLPTAVLRPERAQRAYLSGLLARNEIDRDYAYNRHLLRRVAHGLYHLDMRISLRTGGRDGDWVPIATALNIALIKEVATHYAWADIDAAQAAAGLAPLPVPAARERSVREHDPVLASVSRRSVTDGSRQPSAHGAAPASGQTDEPGGGRPSPGSSADLVHGPDVPWGTPRAKEQARARLAWRIKELRRTRGEEP